MSQQKINDSARLIREAANGVLPPAAILASPSKTLLWRAIAAGEQMHKHLAAVSFGWHTSTADRAINELHDAGVVHIVGWTRNGDRGPMTKIVAFGPGVDAARPQRLSNAFVCKRWRNRHPDQAKAIDRSYQLQQRAQAGRLPVGKDALLAAIMGHPREVTPQ